MTLLSLPADDTWPSQVTFPSQSSSQDLAAWPKAEAAQKVEAARKAEAVRRAKAAREADYPEGELTNGKCDVKSFAMHSYLSIISADESSDDESVGTFFNNISKHSRRFKKLAPL